MSSDKVRKLIFKRKLIFIAIKLDSEKLMNKVLSLILTYPGRVVTKSQFLAKRGNLVDKIFSRKYFES